MAAPTLLNWDQQVLKDLGVQQGSNAYGSDLNFLESWTTREGWPNTLPNIATYNPLGNMSGPNNSAYGATPIGGNVNPNLLAYGSMEGGAADTANRIKQYSDLYSGFTSGSINTNSSYSGLGTWSGGSYTSLSGSSPGNPNSPSPPPGTQNNPAQAAEVGIQNQYLQRQINLQNQLAQIDQQYAQKEAVFQERLLGLQRQSLGIQEGALGRAMAEAPMLQADVEKMYQLEFAGIKQQGQDTNRQYRQALTDMASHGAATGGSFTKGMRDEHANTIADWASATASLQRQRANLQLQQNEEAIQYLEKLAAYQDQKKQYDLTSQKLGIQGDEIAARLRSTLQQTAIGAGENVADLFTQVAMNDASLLGALGPVNLTQLGNMPTNPNAPTGQSPWVGDPSQTMPSNFGQPGAGPY